MPFFEIIANVGSRFFLFNAIQHLESVRVNDYKYWSSITDLVFTVPVSGKEYYVTCPPKVKSIELNLQGSNDSTIIYFESENTYKAPTFDVNFSGDVTIYWNNVELDYNSQNCDEDMSSFEDE